MRRRRFDSVDSDLLIVNIFGVYTRCQLEVYSRNSFREKRNAQQNADDKTRFLHQLSHNLRQPLQALSCYSSVLETACNEPKGLYLQHITSRVGLAVDELNRAINHIFEIANYESGKQIPKLASVDINVLLAGLENLFAPQAAKRGLRLNVRLRANPPYNVYTDPSILSQIIGNLVDNAIKYTRSGWISMAVVKISPERLKLHIRDSGLGIPEDLRDEIFKESVRAIDRRDNDTGT